MNSSRFIRLILKNEENIFLLKKKSEAGLLDNTIFGLINLIRNRDKDYFLITNVRIVLLVKNKIIYNLKYNYHSKINFNSNNDTILFEDFKNNEQKRSLVKMRLTYEEIQKIKEVLN